jgi:glycosyltransferase involved in cell wall biosynthesis
VHYPVLSRGGAEKSILRLLEGLASRGCQVKLVLGMRGGDLENEIDSRISVFHLRDTVGHFPVRIRTLSNVITFGVSCVQWGWGRLQRNFRKRKFSGEQFDAAIVGVTGRSPAFICENIRANKRFVFVRSHPLHADKEGRWAANIRNFHHHIDGYLCVSDRMRVAMLELYPELKGKLFTAYNLLNPSAMCANAAGPNPFLGGPSTPTVLSVCRLQESSKGLLRMVEVHRKLLDAGVAHVWHVLGDGPDIDILKQAIHDANVQSSFILHGAIANPFPWYRHADVVAVLSRYEGLCGVVNEARVLERPVVATRFAGIEEQIESGVNGLLVEQDVDAICVGMKSMLQDATLRDRLAAGGYPKELLDDEAKLDKLLALILAPSAAAVKEV